MNNLKVTNKKILILILGMFVFSLGIVSAEKNWSFEDYSVNISNDFLEEDFYLNLKGGKA